MTSRIVNAMLIGFAASILLLAGYGLVDMTQLVHAAPPAIPDCVAIGKTGPLVVSRCEDEKTGDVIYVNNYGFMVLVQE